MSEIQTEHGLTFFIGRCPRKGCKTIHRMAITLIPRRRETGWPRRTITVLEPAEWPGNLQIYCREHRTWIQWKRIKATISESHICDARCMSAIGPNCECSCGGKNHGGKISLI